MKGKIVSLQISNNVSENYKDVKYTTDCTIELGETKKVNIKFTAFGYQKSTSMVRRLAVRRVINSSFSN
jgi:hypothetical protein